MSTVPVVQGAGSSNSAQDISTSSVPLTLQGRISNLLSSTAFKVGLVVMGLLLVMATIFLVSAASFVNPIYLAIPAIVGCVNICVGILSMEGYCSPERWSLCKKVLKASEDIIDDGQINNSNKVFTDERLNAIGGVVESLSRRNSLVDQTQ
ncbi:cysteine-rich outer membrane protein [Chlamydia trachomatis]|uniref:Sulfur-rich protein, serovars L1/L3 n=2 Tax=Chlamydia trachomatis TaxID=813 RepID=SRPL_CHLTH|nr:cysteine-rich outer membrane protein [Chlamydia trachomatis]P18587.1 RecName: Full=Sulfur-rich protein, serovars L1/L3; AltName: Full=15 kDa cysteine-rich outer membrane protein; AltName: Full=Cysteine-rich protein A [Chlamydia trachomatis]AAA23120.1 15-kDa serine-rich outer membrane protein [Chlamydia trachomatis]AFU24263.1 cysteine-rich membrane protein [Chlamydia trachomatis]AFU24265.1 cysteine-rich membrane protein [Chlamydia trachomatis]CAA38262.1 sulfur-rich protein [Chlamydia trachom